MAEKLDKVYSSLFMVENVGHEAQAAVLEKESEERSETEMTRDEFLYICVIIYIKSFFYFSYPRIGYRYRNRNVHIQQTNIYTNTNHISTSISYLPLSVLNVYNTFQMS